MNTYVITVCYCRSAQLARCLLEYVPSITTKHIFVQAHYPIDTERNNKEIALIVESFARRERMEDKVELWDPGGDIGSAQSQQWALSRLEPRDKDMWVNLDPDSICKSPHWQSDMRRAFEADPNLVVLSCMSPMVADILKARGQTLEERDIGWQRVGIPLQPTPFNLSMFRCSFIKEMGGLRQGFPSWGELEGIIYHEATSRGKYHGYLLDHMEDESNKFFHPKSNAEWKDKHARTYGPEQFLGTYDEYIRWKYPHLADLKL